MYTYLPVALVALLMAVSIFKLFGTKSPSVSTAHIIAVTLLFLTCVQSLFLSAMFYVLPT